MTRYYVHYGESYDASFTTPEEARKEALRALDGWRDDARANDGWADEAASVAWGEVREIATLIPHAGAVEEDGLDDRGVDYELRAPDEDMVRAALTTPEGYVGAMNDAVVEELERVRADFAALRIEHEAQRAVIDGLRASLATVTRKRDEARKALATEEHNHELTITRRNEKRAIIRQQLRQLGAARSVCMTCGQCGKERGLVFMFRCFECGIWFCDHCGPSHWPEAAFGRQDYHNVLVGDSDD